MAITRNFANVRRQEDNDVHLRHCQNDRLFHQRKQDFAVKGKKLVTMREVELQHRIYAYVGLLIERK